MLHTILSFFTFIATSILWADASLDLETLSQDFVVEAKQLQIPGHPNACNPSLVRWHNQLLLSFDVYIERSDEPDGVGLAYLDEGFNVIGEPQILDLPRNLWQDPRLITMGDQLYLVHNGSIAHGVRRMFVTQVRYEEGKFILEMPEPLLHFPGEQPLQWERNWVPFVNNDTLFLTYSLAPHRVLQPIFGTQRCEQVAATTFSSGWTWGHPKPGTAALLDGDHYLALFHSIKKMATIHSEGKTIQHYFIGAYTFESHPPFAVTCMSEDPIIGKNFYHGPEYEMIKPCRAVFPCGIVVDDAFVWAVFGRQDHEVWMAKLDKRGLYESMRPVASN